MSHKEAQSALNEYLDALTALAEPEYVEKLELASKLLETANKNLIQQSQDMLDVPEQDKLLVLSAVDENIINTIACKENDNSVETVSREAVIDLRPLQKRLPSRFQALFFEVEGLTLALPLIELGGIVQMQALTKLPSKPSWFLGMLVEKDLKYQCVDTAQWVMPEKYDNKMQQGLSYAYAIQLGKTPWALACSQLATTHELTHDDIKWRDQGTNRPWLAGMIKQKMCALIDASRLIDLLESKP